VPLPNLIPGSATGHSKYQQSAISIAIADLTRGAATQTFAPGDKNPRAATVFMLLLCRTFIFHSALLKRWRRVLY